MIGCLSITYKAKNKFNSMNKLYKISKTIKFRSKCIFHVKNVSFSESIKTAL